jgi:hypothetical protein
MTETNWSSYSPPPLSFLFTNRGFPSAPLHLHKSRVSIHSSPSSQVEGFYPSSTSSQVECFHLLLYIFTSRGFPSSPSSQVEGFHPLLYTSSQIKGFHPLLSIFTSRGFPSTPLHLHKLRVSIHSSTSSQIEVFHPLLSIFTS